MTTLNVQSGGTEVQPSLAQSHDARRDPKRPGGAGKWGGQLDKSFWLNYTLIGAGITTTLGVIMLLWGSAQNSPILMLFGACLLSAGTLGWMGAFVFFSWLLVRDAGPLIWRRLNGIRQFFPKFNSKGNEQ